MDRTDDEILKHVLKQGLHGEMAHVRPEAVFEDFDWNQAATKPVGAAHSVWDNLMHLIYWQNYSLALLRGENPISPEHANESWDFPERPSSEAEWKVMVARFLDGISQAEAYVMQAEHLCVDVAGRENMPQVQVIHALVGHNSYHLGQIVLLRQQQHSWPPPSGGNTW